jgi:hypothetical protein
MISARRIQSIGGIVMIIAGGALLVLGAKKK